MKYFFSGIKMKNSEDYVNTDEMTDAVFNALRNDDAKTLKQYLNSGFLQNLYFYIKFGEDVVSYCKFRHM